MRGATRLTVLAAAAWCVLAAPVAAFDASVGWTPVQGVAGYRLYLRQTNQTYTGGVDVGLLHAGADGVVRYIYRGLRTGVINYFAVTVYDASGMESGRSNELSLLVTATPTVSAAVKTPISTQQAKTQVSSLTPTPTAARVVGAGCAATPVPGCVTPGRSKIYVKGPGKNSKLQWTWLKGRTVFADFGDPMNGSSTYRLCIYDAAGGVPSLKLGGSAPAAGMCADKACWRQVGSANPRGFKYKDSDLVPNGLQLIGLKAGRGGKARIIVKARGANLAPTLPLNQDPDVTVQLVKSDGGVCWQAVYSAPAMSNSGTRFKDRTP